MKIYIIRHAEGLHNAKGDYSIFDPAITNKGYQQCEAIKDKFKNIDIIFSSTSVRTLQTASAIFPGRKIYATDLLLEYNTGINCNKRNDISKQREYFPHVDFDAYLSHPLDKEKTWEDGNNRAKRFISILKLLNHKKVVIVSHCNFIRNLAYCLGVKNDPKLENCEYLKINLS